MAIERLLLKPEEAAASLGFSRAKLYALIASGELPSIRLGGCLRMPSDKLREWIDAQTVAK